MSNLESLSAKIIEEANTKAEAILKEAADNKVLMIESKTKQAEALKTQMLEKANNEAKTEKQRIISNAKLTVRDEKLVAKQKMIDKVFAMALEKLSQTTESEYLELVKKYLMSMSLVGDEDIIIPGKYKEIVNEKYISQINTELKTLGKMGEIKLSSDARDITSGFIVLKNGIEINNTFESLVNSLRAELEPEIVEQLFK